MPPGSDRSIPSGLSPEEIKDIMTKDQLHALPWWHVLFRSKIKM